MSDNKALADRLSVDALAQAIREVDGWHDLGAGALAEALAPYIDSLTSPQADKARGEVVDVALYGPSLEQFGRAYEEAACTEEHWPTVNDVFKFVQARAEEIARAEAAGQYPEAIDFEAYASRRGAGRGDIGEAGAHKRSRRQTDKQWSRIVKGLDEKNAEVIERRKELRAEYDAAVDSGEIRKPSRIEKLRATAAGHPDNPSVQAARRLIAALSPQADKARGDGLDYVPGEFDRTAPARIWLQIDTSGDNAERDEPWPGADHVTWQDEEIGGLEIAYVRADLATNPQPQGDASPKDDGLRGEVLQFITDTPEDVTHKRLVSLGWTPPQVQGGVETSERDAAEQHYTMTAFDYVRDPVGSRDWTLFWKGWQARAVLSTPQARPDGGADWRKLAIDTLPYLPGNTPPRNAIIAAIDHPAPAPDVARLVVDQLRQELAEDKEWDYTQYEKGRIAEKERCIALLTAAQQKEATNGQE